MNIPLRLTTLTILSLCSLGAEGSRVDETELNGTWQVVTSVFDGVAVSEENVKARQMIFDGNRLTPVVAKARKKAIDITLDPKASPKRIDIKNAGQTDLAKGIYELSGNDLKISYGEPGKDRPGDWESKAGGRIFVMTLKRVNNK